MKTPFQVLLLCGTVMLGACGGSGGSGGASSPQTPTERGALLENPPASVVNLSAADMVKNWPGLVPFAGQPVCGVKAHYLKYATVGARGEATTATGALMLPMGTDPACNGALPVVLYAHGTTLDKSYNIAAVNNSANSGYGEGAQLALGLAGQGFMVVAPNYAGYDTSPLPYHPYHNADQQSKDMMDALQAARTALPGLNAKASDKLFISGYSQGGHVAMATHRAMQAAGMNVTASAPLSGAYALAATSDAVFSGRVTQGATAYSNLLINSFQSAYGDLYSKPEDVYNPLYATSLDMLLPSKTPIGTLVSQGQFPAKGLFSTTPPAAPAGSDPALQARLNAATTPPTTPAVLASTYAQGFSTQPMVNNTARLSYLQDAFANPDGSWPTRSNGLPASNPSNPVRQAFKRNDLRNWTPVRSVLLCGGNADPQVPFDLNAQNMAQYWQQATPAIGGGLLTLLDVDSAIAGQNDPYAAAKTTFSNLKNLTISNAIAAGATDGGANAVLQSYHGALVGAACSLAARQFFQQQVAVAKSGR
jgi:hypothetical protein